MVIPVNNRKTFSLFYNFNTKLYNNCECYVPPIHFFFKKELKKIILQDKSYTALLCLRDNEVVGKIMYTVEYSQKRLKNVCYFSSLEFINDKSVVDELLNYLQQDMQKKAINYLEGTYAPYDPDNRRGILIKGFTDKPTIFTSYNHLYYQDILEQSGFKKISDTLSLDVSIPKAAKFFDRFLKSKKIDIFNISCLSKQKELLQKDLQDIYQIMKRASNELNYAEAPSFSMIENVFKSMKMFINFDFIKIAREKATQKPIGFVAILPDFNEIIKKTNGHLSLKFLNSKKYCKRTRGFLQYVIPEYQKSPVLFLMFNEVLTSFRKFGITEFEAGTILEENESSWKPFIHLGGEISKVYRIYGKEF